MRVYAGIGSRRTPADVLDLMERLAAALAASGWWLRSGHAPGADRAFERGAAGRADVFLPWRSFEGATAVLGRRHDGPLSLGAYEIAARHHPGWARLSRGPRALHARNVHQVLGVKLDTPARFVMCWTPDGSLDGRGRDTGGTGQALRIAVAYGVPVFNLARSEHRARVESWLVA